MPCNCVAAGWCSTHLRRMSPVFHSACKNVPGAFESFAKIEVKPPHYNLESDDYGPNDGSLCYLRGAKIEDRVCDTCGNRGTIQPVYQCSVYGECSDWEKFKSVKSCRWCHNFLSKPPVARNPVGDFNRVYCVNLDRRRDRWESFIERAKSVDDWPLTEVIRFAAVDGWQPETPPWWNAGGGAWGCRESHVRILRECVEQGVGSVLILEDDASFPKDFGDRLRAFLRAVPDDWEQLYLGGQHMDCFGRPSPRLVAPGVLKTSNVSRTHAWAFRGEGIAKALAYFEDLEDWQQYPRDHLDHRAGRLHESGTIKSYCPEKWIVAQGENASDIDGKRHGERWWLPNKSYPHVNGYWTEASQKHHRFDLRLANAIAALLSRYEVRTVYDLGCGPGQYVAAFEKAGFDVVGLDGNPNTPEMTGGRCGVADLTQPLELEARDCVVSLEVGEHIPAQYESAYLDNVTKHARKLLILSWAIPGQGGFGHVNERPLSAIAAEVENRGFKMNETASHDLREAASLRWFRSNVMVFERLFPEGASGEAR